MKTLEIEISRSTFTKNSTISDWTINGERKCCGIEDVDRGLHQQMSLEEIEALKVHGKTAIPYGRYKVTITMSNRFKVLMPILHDVPGYAGVRIHPGNTAADTEGCLLPGLTKGVDFVGSSRGAYSIIYNAIDSALKRGEEVFVTIKKTGL